MTGRNIPPEGGQVKGEKQTQLPVLEGLAEKASFPFKGGSPMKSSKLNNKISFATFSLRHPVTTYWHTVIESGRPKSV
jgi:hypothetical protein